MSSNIFILFWGSCFVIILQLGNSQRYLSMNLHRPLSPKKVVLYYKVFSYFYISPYFPGNGGGDGVMYNSYFT